MIVREAGLAGVQARECRHFVERFAETVPRDVEKAGTNGRGMRCRNPRAVSSSSTSIRFASLVLVFITIVALAAVAYFTERGILVNRDWVVHTYQVRSQLNDLEMEWFAPEQCSNKLLCRAGRSCHPGERGPFARQTVIELRTLTKDNPRQQLRLDQFGHLLDESSPLFENSSRST